MSKDGCEMRIACLGGGPAGLYFAISMKLRNPAHDIEIIERNRAGDTFGWGVVFSDQTVENLRANDPVSAEAIIGSFASWDDIVVRFRGEAIRSTGHGFIGIGRKRLLAILQDRARELGVRMSFETEFDADLDAFAGFDLIVAADGINSRLRTRFADRFGVDIQTRANKYVWLGTERRFDAFEFIFEETPAGLIWAHAYRFEDGRSTFIVECSEDTWRGLGFDRMGQDETCRACEAIFSAHLDGHPLSTNAKHLRGSAWLNFNRILCACWTMGNLVLLGDAAHTAHFSIGSGTKLAIEDAIKLAEVLNAGAAGGDTGRADTAGWLPAALQDYEDVRRVEVLKLQNAARNSTEWFETLGRYQNFDPVQFTYALLTRSQRVSHENLRLRDPAWLAEVERRFAARAAAAVAPDDAPTTAVETPTPPPLFTPFRLRGVTLANRVVVSPVLTYGAGPDGAPDDGHLVHYGARALGGAGLVMTEMTAVGAGGRITPQCLGLYDDAQMPGWRRLVDFVHNNSAARIGIQLGHAGARGAVTPDDTPLPAGGDWPLIAASALARTPGGQVPAAMTLADMAAVRDDFVAATRRADDLGVDLIEIQAGHGYLLSGFITPLMNRRADDFGGTLDNRLRFPLAVVAAVRAAWPEHKPLAVRISASDWMGDAGITPDDAVLIARALTAAGVDLIDVSSGETSAEARPVFGRLYQTPFADQIRNEAGCAVMAVGNIYEADQVNAILAAGRADLVALGRPHLIDPMWALRAAAELAYRGGHTPPAYRPGQAQLARNLARAQEIASL